MVIEHKVNNPKINLSKVHTKETHQFHIRRYGHCLYCDNGFKIIKEREVKTVEIPVEIF